jgi:ABC-type sugar transport system permease subunit
MNAVIVLIGALLYAPMVWQDFRERRIYTIFLLLPYANFVIEAIEFPALLFISVFMALVVLLATLLLYMFGMVADGDMIASPLLFAEIFALKYIMPVYTTVFAAHMFYGLLSEKDSKWFGETPLVGYIGLANMVGVAVFVLISF